MPRLFFLIFFRFSTLFSATFLHAQFTSPTAHAFVFQNLFFIRQKADVLVQVHRASKIVAIRKFFSTNNAAYDSGPLRHALAIPPTAILPPTGGLRPIVRR